MNLKLKSDGMQGCQIKKINSAKYCYNQFRSVIVKCLTRESNASVSFSLSDVEPI